VQDEQAGLVIDFDVCTAAEAMETISENLAAFQVNARRVVARHFDGAAASPKFRMLFQKAIVEKLGLKNHESTDVQPVCRDENSIVERTSATTAGGYGAQSSVLGRRPVPLD